MKKLLSAVTSVVMSASLMTGAFASSVSAAGSLTVEQPNISMGEVLDVSAKTFAADGSVEWKLPTITAAPGQTVTMPIVVQGTGLEIAGGQFVIKAASPIAFNSIVTGNAYGYEIASNADENTFLFSGVKGIVAAENSVVGTLKFTIPADCAEGKYDVKWSEGTASAPGGKNVTDKVKFTDGVINVKKGAEGTVEWVLDNVTAVPGQKVNLSAYVNNADGSAVGVAGGQFVIDADKAVKFDSVKDGGAYDAKIEVNAEGEKPAFLFSKVAKDGVVAADKAEIMTLTYTVPADCPAGKYDVKWAEQVVSDGLAKNITSKVKFTNGSITVKSENSGKIKWVLGNETAKPGDTVKLSAVVDDADKAAVAIAGAQFAINSASKDIKLVGVSAKSEAYDAAISSNLDENVVLFGKPGSASVAAADGKTVVTLEFKVDEKCADGKYDIKWADTTISNALSKNITSNVEFVNGSITVNGKDETSEVSWVIPDVTVDAGATSAELKVQIKGDSDLAVAGAQFAIDVKSPITLSSVSGKPYGATLADNKDKNSYLFATVKGATAKDGDVFATLTFDIPAGTTGTYPVKWADTVVSAEKGVNISSKVKLVDGSITIGGTTSTTVTTSTTSSTVTTLTTSSSVTNDKTTSTSSSTKEGSKTTTTSTTVSFPITTTTAAPVVIPEDKSIAWLVDNVYAYPGEEVKVEIKVYDPNKKALAIAGAQFDVESGANATLTAVGKKSAYGAEVMTSDDKVRLLFADSKLSSAADGSVVAELTYKVSDKATAGEVIPVDIKNLVVAGEKSKNISSLVYTRKGSITVVPKQIIEDPTTTTTTSITTTTTKDSGTTTTTTSGTTTTTKDSGTTTTTTKDGGSTTTTTKDGGTTTTTTKDGGTTTTTTKDGGTTTTTTKDGGSTTTTTKDGGTTTTTTSGTTTTTKDSSTTTTTTTNNDPITTTKAGYKSTYASIETEVGFYFSHDNGTVSGGFKKSQIKTIHIYDVYNDGHKEEQTVNTDLINFNNVTPEDAYNSVPHVVGQGTAKDFQYSIDVYYGSNALVDENGKSLSITAYIGVKGDITLNNIVDSGDASIVQKYYASLSTGGSVDEVVCQSANPKSGSYQVSDAMDALDQLAAFLGDVTEDEYSVVNWKTTKSGRVIDAVDAARILSYYAKRSTRDASVSNYSIWQEVNKTDANKKTEVVTES